jgi:hypothetical protein
MAEEPKTVSLEEAIEGKKSKLIEAEKQITIAEQTFAQPETAAEIESLYSRFRTGKYENLERNRVRWIPPGPRWTKADLFEFIPKKFNFFTFVRHTGEAISPRNMITDIGSIPRLAGLFGRGLTPWGYAAAYIVHDWEFEAHHCGANKPFDEVRDTMMEGVKTLMESRLCPKESVTFWLLYQAISSGIAHGYWDRKPPKCTLPPYNPEPC